MQRSGKWQDPLFRRQPWQYNTQQEYGHQPKQVWLCWRLLSWAGGPEDDFKNSSLQASGHLDLILSTKHKQCSPPSWWLWCTAHSKGEGAGGRAQLPGLGHISHSFLECTQALLTPTGRCASRPGMWLREPCWSQRPAGPSPAWMAASTLSFLAPISPRMASCTSQCSPSCRRQLRSWSRRGMTLAPGSFQTVSHSRFQARNRASPELCRMVEMLIQVSNLGIG